MEAEYIADLRAVTEVVAAFVLKHRSADLMSDPALTDRMVRDCLTTIGREVCAQVFARQGELAEVAAKAKGYRVVRAPKITFMSVFGAIEVRSAYMQRAGEPHGIRPLNDLLRVRGMGRTISFERVLCDFGVDASFDNAAKKVKEHYGLIIHRTTIGRTVLKHGARADFGKWLTGLDAMCAPLGDRQCEPLLVEMDGCSIRTGKLTLDPAGGETPVRKLNKRKRTTEWRDLRLGFARLLAKKEPKFVGGILEFGEIAHRLQAAASELGMTPETYVVRLSDGGNGVREALDLRFKKGQFILDKPHLAHHLCETAALWHSAPEEASRLAKRWLATISAGGVPAVVEELQRAEGAAQARSLQLVRYLHRFSDAISYDSYVARGLPVGSGEIESAHKSQVQCRLKLPGTWWKPEHANHVLSLRLCRSNNEWEQHWKKAAAA